MDEIKSGTVYGTPLNDQYGRTFYVSRVGLDTACNVYTTSPFPDDKSDYLALRLNRQQAQGLVGMLQGFLADTSQEKTGESIDGKLSPNGAETGKSSDLKYKIGDRVVYPPLQTVAEVVDVVKINSASGSQLFYSLHFPGTSRKNIFVPAMIAGSVGLRLVPSELEISKVYDILHEHPTAIDNQEWARRYHASANKFVGGSIYSIAEVVRDLSRREVGRLSFGEKRMLKTARDILAEKIAFARSQTVEQAEQEIEAIFQKKASR